MEIRFDSTRTRGATSLLLAADEAGSGTWVALLPALQAKHALREGEPGRAMFGTIAGAIVSMLAMVRGEEVVA